MKKINNLEFTPIADIKPTQDIESIYWNTFINNNFYQCNYRFKNSKKWVLFLRILFHTLNFLDDLLINFLDFAGSTEKRTEWHKFYEKASAIVFVIDISDCYWKSGEKEL